VEIKSTKKLHSVPSSRELNQTS